VLAWWLLDPGRCCCRQGRLRVRQGPAAGWSLRPEGRRSGRCRSGRKEGRSQEV